MNDPERVGCTTVGALLGTSTVTTYVESASGVAQGGRSGLTALTVAGLFLVALPLAPLFLLIPVAATAPVLVIVGLFMLKPVLQLDLDDITEPLPASLTLIALPFTFSISEGIVFGSISYVLLKLGTGRCREVPALAWGLAVLFVLKIVLT